MDPGVGLGEIATRAKDLCVETLGDAIDHEIDDVELRAVMATFAEFREGRSGFFGSLKIEISDLKARFPQETGYESVADCRKVEARTGAH